MTIEVAAAMWGELRRYVNTVDRAEAAESVVAVLVDNDFDADKIRDGFNGDNDIKRALTEYLGNISSEEEIDEEDPDEDDYSNWED